jgi:CRP-like cAMP-binding protein
VNRLCCFNARDRKYQRCDALLLDVELCLCCIRDVVVSLFCTRTIVGMRLATSNLVFFVCLLVYSSFCCYIFCYRSTVTCASDSCRLHEMPSDDFLAVVESSPEMAASLRNMCRKRLFKKAVKAYSLANHRGFSDADIVAAFHDADIDNSGSLNLDEVRRLMHRMDPKFPMEEIVGLLQFVDVDEDGQITLEDFKRLFRQFEQEKADA